MILSLLLLLVSLSSPAHAAIKQAPEPFYLSVGLGLPVPAGGMLSLDLNRRLAPDAFVQFGLGTAGLAFTTYLSYGGLWDNGKYWFAGVDATYVALFFNSADFFPQPTEGTRLLPGVHGGIGKEWFPGGHRVALALNVGFPWVFGLRLLVGT